MKPVGPWRTPVAVCVALGIAILACADKQNPVVPATSSLPGAQAGAIDAAVEVGDAGPAVVPRNDAASTGVCDLLAQTGCLDTQGCYPLSGIGVCDAAGSNGPLGDCALGDVGDEQQTRCGPGLACIPQSRGDATGQCLPLCDPFDYATTCAAYDDTCVAPLPLAGFTSKSRLGYCSFSF